MFHVEFQAVVVCSLYKRTSLIGLGQRQASKQVFWHLLWNLCLGISTSVIMLGIRGIPLLRLRTEQLFSPLELISSQV